MSYEHSPVRSAVHFRVSLTASLIWKPNTLRLSRMRFCATRTRLSRREQLAPSRTSSELLGRTTAPVWRHQRMRSYGTTRVSGTASTRVRHALPYLGGGDLVRLRDLDELVVREHLACARSDGRARQAGQRTGARAPLVSGE
jgi:hypothetical protein